jgi:Glycosyl transferase family 2
MSESSRAPALSVILPCEEGFEYVRRTVRALRMQTVRDQIELVLITTTNETLDLESEEVTGFHSVRVVVAPGLVGNRARAVGIRCAGAPIVALAEDHCYPEPGWAAALIATLDCGWSAVGPAMYNANPASALSWVNLILAFGPWVGPAEAGTVAQLPWHNTTYKRAPLLEYGGDLGELMDVEGMLQQDLARKGHRFYHEVAAQTYHLNISRFSSTIIHRLDAGRLFAGCRSRSWSPLKRLAYILGAPLIPFIRLWRALPLLRKVDARPGLVARILPVLVGCLVLDTFGETAGYALGAGNTASRVELYERMRFRYLSRTDRRVYDAGGLGRPA